MQSKSKPLSLQPVNNAPSAASLGEMAKLAREHPGATVELVVNARGLSFLLGATSIGQREIHWSFYSKDSALWSIPSSDFELLENMVASSIDQTVGTTHVTVIGAPSGAPPQPVAEQAPAPAPAASAPLRVPIAPANPNVQVPPYQSPIQPQQPPQGQHNTGYTAKGSGLAAAFGNKLSQQQQMPQATPAPGQPGMPSGQFAVPANTPGQPPALPQGPPALPQSPQTGRQNPPALPQTPQPGGPPALPQSPQSGGPPALPQSPQSAVQGPPALPQNPTAPSSGPPPLPLPAAVPQSTPQGPPPLPGATPSPRQSQVPPAIPGQSQGPPALPQSSQAAVPASGQPAPGIQQPGAQGNSPTSPAGVTLAGELSEVELSNVIQSVSICRMTGKLHVHQLLEAVELYFEEGVLVHANLESTLNDQPKRLGDQIMLELMTWERGEFRFDQGVRTGERSVTRRIDALLMEGATLADHKKQLNKFGLDMESRPVKCATAKTEEDFDRIVKDGVPVDQAIQKRMYLDFDGQLTVYDETKRLQLASPSWIPIMLNLLSLDLLRLPEKEQVDTDDHSGPLTIDRKQSTQAWKQVLDADSTALSYPLFMHFYLMEFERAIKCAATQFTVAVIDLKYKNGSAYEAPANFAIREIMEHIIELKCQPDLIGEYPEGYLMLMPHETGDYAKELANRISERLQHSSAENLFDMRNVRITFGTATAPFDASDPSMLLKLAYCAKDRALQENLLIKQASELDAG